MDNALCDLYDDPYMVEALLDKSLQTAVNRAKAFQKCGVDTIYVGDPWSSCSVISPQIFEKYSFPCFKRFAEEIKPLGLTVYAHICGNVGPIIERIADMGVHCIEPMDPLGGVSASEFRSRVGSKVALMGGVNTVTLANGTRRMSIRRPSVVSRGRAGTADIFWRRAIWCRLKRPKKMFSPCWTPREIIVTDSCRVKNPRDPFKGSRGFQTADKLRRFINKLFFRWTYAQGALTAFRFVGRPLKTP
jgi:hypothetical protein